MPKLVLFDLGVELAFVRGLGRLGVVDVAPANQELFHGGLLVVLLIEVVELGSEGLLLLHPALLGLEWQLRVLIRFVIVLVELNLFSNAIVFAVLSNNWSNLILWLAS